VTADAKQQENVAGRTKGAHRGLLIFWRVAAMAQWLWPLSTTLDFVTMKLKHLEQASRR
jgi:hypothetical protein